MLKSPIFLITLIAESRLFITFLFQNRTTR